MTPTSDTTPPPFCVCPPAGHGRDIFIFVNGILTRPGNAFAWTDKAVQWMNTQGRAGSRAEKFEYYTPALLRRFFQRGHADNLAETIAQYPIGHRIHLVGHSNGCDLIARAIRLTAAPIASVHFIAGAVERDFSKNGLGERLQRGQISQVACFCSAGDDVLRYVARPSQIFSFLGLGYGDLGLRGPAGLNDAVLRRVRVLWRNTYGHSDWFSPENFEHTLQAIALQAIHP